MHANKNNIVQEQKKKITVLPLNQLGTSIISRKLKIVPQTQLQSQVKWTVLNTKNKQLCPGQILLEKGVSMTAPQTEQSTLYSPGLRTYQKSSSKSLKNKQEKSPSVLPKIAIHRDKLVKVEPLIEESVISDNNASSTNISICSDFNSSTTESVHTHDNRSPEKDGYVLKTPKITIYRDRSVKVEPLIEKSVISENNASNPNISIRSDFNSSTKSAHTHDNKSFVKDGNVLKTPKITINKKKLIKIGSLTDAYDQVINSNKFIVQNEVANTSMATGTQTMKIKLLDIPLINDLKFEKPMKVSKQQIKATNSNIQTPETKSTTKELESSQYSINKEEIAKTEQESTESYDFYYDNNIVCGDEIEAIQEIEHVQDDVKKETDETENEDIKYVLNDNEIAAEQSIDINESGQMETDQTNIIVENGVDDGLQKLTVVSANTTFTVMLRAVPDDEKDALMERLQAQNIVIPKYSTNDCNIGNENKAWCDFCNKSFSNKKTCAIHRRRMHLGIKVKRRSNNTSDNVCQTCGRKCITKVTLMNHMRTHTGERPYECSICLKRFNTVQLLQVHFRTHTNERPFKCANCPKAFRQKAALNRHIRVHTGVKPYTCSHCNKSFSQSNSMKLHIRTVHMKLPTPYPSKKYKKIV